MRGFMTAVLLALFLCGGGWAAAEERKSSTTTYVNENGETVRGNWTSGEIIEVKTVEDYYWHLEHFDPSAHYEVAPWLYDPNNLERESGADHENRH